MADKQSDRQASTKWSRTFGVHADPDGTALNAAKGLKRFFHGDPGGPFNLTPAGFFLPIFLVGSGVYTGMNVAEIESEIMARQALPTIDDTSLQTGIQNNQYGVVGFEYEERSYMLVRDQDDYRLFKRDNYGGHYAFIQDVEDAYPIILKAGQAMESYVETLEQGGVSESQPNLKVFSGVSKVYGEEGYAYRFASARERLFSTGESFVDIYRQQSDMLGFVAQEILKGHYGFAEEPDYLERGYKMVVEERFDRDAEAKAKIGGGIFSGTLAIALLGGGLCAANAGRRASRRRAERGNRPGV